MATRERHELLLFSLLFFFLLSVAVFLYLANEAPPTSNSSQNYQLPDIQSLF